LLDWDLLEDSLELELQDLESLELHFPEAVEVALWAPRASAL